MTIATETLIQDRLMDETFVQTKFSLADYLAYHDGTGNRYELVKGALKPMSLGTGLHGDLMEFIHDEFRDEIKRTQQPWTSKQAAVSVQSPRSGRWETCRSPDVEEGSYMNYRFAGEDAIVSPVFPGLQLTSAQVLAGSR